VAISTRVREESGFGLVELLIAMTVLAIGITALVAGMSSGMVAVQRAAQSSTAAAVADKQMETYRAIRYDNIALKKTLVDAAASPYSGDAALIGDAQNGNFVLTDLLVNPSACSSTPTPVTCVPVQSSVPGPDGRSYRIDSYVVWTCAVGNLNTSSPEAPGCTAARPSKRVTVVVRDLANPTKTLFRESSTFDSATG
jgi:prepilin-type N-terminal cleavage/methylation domain-containing protein